MRLLLIILSLKLIPEPGQVNAGSARFYQLEK